MKDAEFKIHTAILQWIQTAAPQCVVFHPANGGERKSAEGAKLKAMGVVRGIPDLGIITDGGRIYWIEVKAPDGVLSKDQKAVRDRFMKMAVPCAVCLSIDDARKAFAHWRIETREAGQ